ncbi:hypothetical protein Tco_0049987 [Tanacetum coccineum]
MYPRFLQLVLNNQIDLAEPFNDVYVTPVHTKKVFTNMKRQNKDFSGRVTPLFTSMLVPQVVKGEGLGQPSKPQPPSSTAPPSQVTIVGHETVHKELGDKVERAATTAASLDAEQDSGNIIRTQSIATLNEPIPQGTGSGSGPRRQDTIMGDILAQTRVLALENVKTAHDLEITSLKKREDVSKQGRNKDQDEDTSWFQEDAET